MWDLMFLCAVLSVSARERLIPASAGGRSAAAASQHHRGWHHCSGERSHSHRHRHTHSDTHSLRRTHTQTDAHSLTHSLTHSDTHTHTHTHTQSRLTPASLCLQETLDKLQDFSRSFSSYSSFLQKILPYQLQR